LSQKSPSYLYFEESGVGKMWNQIIHMEVETARVHNNLAQALQKQVYEQLMYIKDAAEKIRKSIVLDGQTSMKELQDSLLSLNKAKELYHKACRDLEVAEYLRKEDEGQVSAQNLQKRDKKVAKCHADVADAETAYRNAIEETKSVQRRYYDESLPRMLDSLQVVYHSRLQKIQECMTSYASEVTQVVENLSSLVVDTAGVCREFQPQQDIEEYIAKTESFFRMPADPVFEQFIRTPEGQVPPSLSVQQKLVNRFHLRKSDKNISVTPESSPSGSVAYAAPTGLLGMTPEEMMEAQKNQYPLLKVPYILVFLADCLLKLGGPKADGIFRISGSLIAMEKVKEHFNKGEYVSPRDVHDSSALFKFILRSFPDPLLPGSLYEEAITEAPNVNEVFNKIPEPSRTVAGFVIRYLRENYLTDESVSATQMNVDNIATVFFPCFMKNPSNDLQEIMKHMDQEKMWVRKCLLSLDVTPYPSLAECLAASSPAQITKSPSSHMLPSEDVAATQRQKALPSKPPQKTPEKPADAAAAASAANPEATTTTTTEAKSAEEKPKEEDNSGDKASATETEKKEDAKPSETEKKEEAQPTETEKIESVTEETAEPTTEPKEEDKVAETKEEKAEPATEEKKEETAPEPEKKNEDEAPAADEGKTETKPETDTKDTEPAVSEDSSSAPDTA